MRSPLQTPGFRYLILAALALVFYLLAYQAPVTLRVDVGGTGDAAAVENFYFAEQNGDLTYRWSGPASQLLFDQAGARPWTLTLRASGLRPFGPALLRLSAGGQLLAELAMGGDMAEYQVAVPRQAFDARGDLRVKLAVEPFVAPPDTRELGVMVDWAELTPAGRAVTLPPVLGLALGLLCVVALAAALDRLGLAPRAGMAAGLLLAALIAAGILWARPELAALLPWLALGLGLLWLLGAWMRGAAWWEWLLLAIAFGFLVAFVTRAADFYRSGLPPGDFTIYFDAAANLRAGRPLYDFEAARGMPNGPVYKYPPLFAMLLAPSTALPVRSVAAGWYLLNLALLAGCFLLLVRTGSRTDGRAAPRGAILLVAIGWLAFRPAWESLIRGQLDVVNLAAAVVAMVLVERRKGEVWAGALLAVATMLKLYPGLLIVYLLWRQRWRVLLGFAVTFGLLIVISGLVAGWDVLWRYVSEVLTVQTAAVPYPENQSIDGLLSRLVIPAGATTWYTTIPFPRGTLLVMYLLALAIFAVTVRGLWGRWGADVSRRQFELGYGATLVVVVLLWPTSWIHYETLLLLPFTVLALDQLDSRPRPWGVLGLLAISYLAVAIGNEYAVLTPALNQDSWMRLLQSYKLYGMLLLWLLLLWVGNRRTAEPAASLRVAAELPGAAPDA